MSIHHLLLAQRYREYYYQDVNKHKRNILNWVLIAMMVMLPLRSVMAFTSTVCDMHDQASQVMEDHSMHMMHQMNEEAQMGAGKTQGSDCCDSEITCSADCSIGMSVTFIPHSAVMLPALYETAFNPLVNNNLVFRELTPPVRPPANLQI